MKPRSWPLNGKIHHHKGTGYSLCWVPVMGEIGQGASKWKAMRDTLSTSGCNQAGGSDQATILRTNTFMGGGILY